MHLMVAGCSFSAVSKTHPGSAWSEVLAKKLGWRLTNLARQGCSNGGIRIQIDEILRQRPTFAIITPTFWDRMEIPARAAPYDWSAHQSGGWNPPLEQHLQNRTIQNGYCKEHGMNNINYGNNNYHMICETIFTLAENIHSEYRSGPIDVLTQKAIKLYIDQLYDCQWKKQQDEWIIMEGIMRLYIEKIAFVVSPVLLWPFDITCPEQWQSIFPDMIPGHYVMHDSKESVLAVSGNYPVQGQDPGYHTNAQGQEVIASNWYVRMTQNHGIQ